MKYFGFQVSTFGAPSLLNLAIHRQSIDFSTLTMVAKAKVIFNIHKFVR